MFPFPQNIRSMAWPTSSLLKLQGLDLSRKTLLQNLAQCAHAYQIVHNPWSAMEIGYIQLYNCCWQKIPNCVVIHGVKITLLNIIYTVEVASDNDQLLIFFRNINPQYSVVYVSHTSVFFKCPFKRPQKSKTFNFVNLSIEFASLERTQNQGSLASHVKI
jgi:hypothetical protein